MKNLFAAAIASIVLFSCTTKATSTSEATKSNSSTTDQIAQGKTIYESACKRCHDLPEPTAFTSVQWVGIMNSMAPKAKLTDEQHQWVYDYVVSVKK